MNKYKELGKNTAIFAVSIFLSKMVSSILVPLYTHTMTTEQYGIADLITTISHFVVPICSLSIHEAVFRFTLDNNNDKKQVLRCGINVSLVAAVLMLIVGLLSKLYKPIEEWTWFLISISILTMERSILSLYTEADGRVLLFGVDSVVCNVVLGMANIFFLVFLSLGISGYFLATIVSLGVSIILLSIAGRIRLLPKYKTGDDRMIKLMVAYSAPLILNSISWILMSLVDRLMLTSIYSSSANGLYAVASKIPTLLTVLTTVFTQAWGLSLVKDYDTDRDDKFYNNVFGMFHLVVMMGTSIILMFTNNLFRFIIGDEFSEAVKYIAVLMVGTVFLTYTNFYSSVYSATKKSSKIAISSFVGLALNVILNGLLIPSIGIMGACIATTASYILIGSYRIIDCRKYVNFQFDRLKWGISMLLLFIEAFFVAINKYDIIASLMVAIMICVLYFDQLKKIYIFGITRIKHE